MRVSFVFFRNNAVPLYDCVVVMCTFTLEFKKGRPLKISRGIGTKIISSYSKSIAFISIQEKATHS